MDLRFMSFECWVTSYKNTFHLSYSNELRVVSIMADDGYKSDEHP